MVKPQLPMIAVVTPSAGEGEAVGVHGFLRGAHDIADLGDAAVLHRHAAAPRRRAQAVEQRRVADHQIEHCGSVY